MVRKKIHLLDPLRNDRKHLVTFPCSGDYRMALVNAAANILFGVTAVAAGWIATRALGILRRGR